MNMSPSMKSLHSILAFSGFLAIATVLTAAQKPAAIESSAASAPAGKLIRVSEKDAAWAAKERKAYPLTVCVASDEDLGSMGDSPEYIYRVAGQRDRLVVFCCEGCEEDFLKEPAKYLAKIDAAKAAKAKAGKSISDGHQGKH